MTEVIDRAVTDGPQPGHAANGPSPVTQHGRTMAKEAMAVGKAITDSASGDVPEVVKPLAERVKSGAGAQSYLLYRTAIAPERRRR